ARAAALALSSGEEREDDSVTAQLIRDISVVFSADEDAPLKTGDLLEGLHSIEESPWGDWYGKALSPHGLSRLLKPYRIKTMPVWADGKTVRGYKVEQFSDAFAQLSVRSVSSVRSEARSHAAPNAPNAPNASTRGDGENGRRLLDCIVCGSEYEPDERHPERLRCAECVAGRAA
ncbi:MAG: DUF3631 domain-containing protein, partial [Actinomycetota bacterium]|nr:DUF3631 domain-containing protein [Actinomycetota bacterium]